MSQTCTCAAIT